jgi:hypothetical protein
VSVYLSTWARVAGFEVGHLEDALYETRSLVRMHGMRRTLWVAPRDSVAGIDSSTTRVIAGRERARTARMLEDGGVTEDGPGWLDDVLPRVLAEVERRGEALTRHITRDLPELRTKLVFHNKAGRVMGTTGVGSRVLLVLSVEGKIMRSRPAGSWVSGQYRWVETNSWLGEPIPEVDPAKASSALVSAWLHTFGPGTELDIKWWTGWPLRQVRRALQDIGAVEVSLDRGLGYTHPGDIEPVAQPKPWVAVLPGLDPTTMGWKERDWYLGPHGHRLFDTAGNAGPTIWVDGRIVGGWAQRGDGEIVHRLLEEVTPDEDEAIQVKIAELNEWIGETRVTPRFWSPLNREMSA